MAPYRIAIMNEDIGEFVYESMQQRTTKDKKSQKRQKIIKKTSLTTLRLYFTKTCFVGCEVHVYAMM